MGWTLDTELLEGYLHFRIDADDGRSIVELVAVTGCREDGDELTIPDHEFIAILNDLKSITCEPRKGGERDKPDGHG